MGGDDWSRESWVGFHPVGDDMREVDEGCHGVSLTGSAPLHNQIRRLVAEIVAESSENLEVGAATDYAG